MRQTIDLSCLSWMVCGYSPFQWLLGMAPEIPPVPTAVPGSAQQALLQAGLLPDWNVGLNARACEWVENRHWCFEALVPPAALAASAGARVALVAEGLDYSGWVLVNGVEAGRFTGSFTPHTFDLTPHLPAGWGTSDAPVRLQIMFDTPPRWLGQFGYTSRMTDWKPRFNYTWDWTSRLVQIGIWDALSLVTTDGCAIDSLTVLTGLPGDSAQEVTQGGTLRAEVETRWGPDPAAHPCVHEYSVRLALCRVGDSAPIHAETLQVGSGGRAAFSWRGIPVDQWWPNGLGAQALYQLTAELLDTDGSVIDSDVRTVGFRSIEWRPCEGARAGADPWLCVVNGEPVFLQGVNWTPIRPNFADVAMAEVERRLLAYKGLGCNVLRVWGGAYLEREGFYDLCDELGLLVWQEFPLSSSGAENWPPEEEPAMGELCAIAESYVHRRQHHACLLLWSGGNELQSSHEGSKTGVGRPVDLTHPLISRLKAVVEALDPGRRFVATSASGPCFTAEQANFGKGLHWDVHGPWAQAGTDAEWLEYWQNDDALFRSEAGCPGASPEAITQAYRGTLPALPVSDANPLWHRTAWWIEGNQYAAEAGTVPESLAAYIEWSQARQATALGVAATATKARFPRCGGFIIWMGHDSFPCTANTSILDFDGDPKPAAYAVAEAFVGGKA